MYKDELKNCQTVSYPKPLTTLVSQGYPRMHIWPLDEEQRG
jgi:hypothetical protein